MTYTYKLSSRLARFRPCAMLCFLLWATACGADNPPTGEGPPASGQEPAVAAVVVAPRTVTAETNQKIQFAAFGQSSAGDSMAVAVEYTASGGSVTPNGVFTAATVGTFKVIGRGKGHTKPDTGVVIVVPPPPTLSAIVVTPDTATLAAGGKKTFAATGKLSDGSTTAVGVNWTATGGTIDAGGNYTAGTVSGTYRVIATGASSPLADTARVTIAASPTTPTLQAVVLTPSTVSLQAAATQQFSASGKMSDGSTGPVSVTYAVTGGTITTAGLYTAGQTAGTFRVIAKQTNGTLADTSAVTITVPSTPSGIAIYPGQSIQAAVNANPAGTTFLVKAGTHHSQSVVPKSNDVFIGEPGTILDGDNAVTYAFSRGSSPYPSNVQIRSLVVQHYTNPAQYGAIHAGEHTAADGTVGWIVADCEIRYNVGAGIRLGHKMQVLRNNIHHNGQIGILGIGDSILIDGNEIAFNNYQKAYSFGWEAGGTKFVKTRWLVVRNNYSHDNWGPGLWTDGDNLNALYEGNRVEDNAGNGIFHEISEAAIIRNNTVLRNGIAGGVSWYYGAGIFISASRNVEIYGNTVSENGRGIIGIMQNRGSGSYGIHELANMYVHDNNVTMSVVATDGTGHNNVSGVAQDVGDLSYFTSKGNRFVHNTYHLGSASRYFTWMNQEVGKTVWTGTYGQDVTGTFIP